MMEIVWFVKFWVFIIWFFIEKVCLVFGLEVGASNIYVFRDLVVSRVF